MRSYCHVCLLSCLSCPSESHSYLRVIAMEMELSRTWLTQAADSPLSRHPSATNKEKNNKTKTRGRHPSANKKRQPQQTSVMKKLDDTSRFVRVIPTLSPNQTSHNSISHGGRYNMVVTQHRHLNMNKTQLSSAENIFQSSTQCNSFSPFCLVTALRSVISQTCNHDTRDESIITRRKFSSCPP